MRPPFAQQSYRAIAIHGDDNDASVPATSQKTKRQHNFKPIPLRYPFLITFMLLFATNVILIELLLRSSIHVASSSAPSSTSSVKIRPRRETPTNNVHVHPRSFPEELECSDAGTLPSQIVAEQAATASLCVDFTSSYTAHTKNLSYPQQTSLQQWIDDFSAVSSSVFDLQMSSSACASQESAGISQGTSAIVSARAEDQIVFTVPVGCGTSIITGNADCPTGVGYLFISDFQLQSGVGIVCAATRDNELAITASTPQTSAPAKASEMTITVPAPAASPDSALPTITQQAKPDSGTSVSQPDVTAMLIVAPVPSTGETATPGGQVQPVAVSVVSVVPGPQVVTFSATDSNGHAQIVTATAAAVAVANTYVTTNADGQVHSIVSNAAAPPPAAYTYVTTDEKGQVQTVVSTEASAVPDAYVYVTTEPNGQVQTVVTKISGGPAALQTVVRTNSLGQTETLVAPASALVPAMTTYTTTDAQGHLHVVTASAYAVAGPLTTYITTDARGQVETVVSKLSSAAAKYVTTTRFTSLIRTTDAAGRPTSFSAVLVETVTLSTSPAPDQASKTSSAILPAATTAKPNFVISSQEKIIDTKFTYGSYMLALYLPAFLAVVVKAAWEMVFSAIKLTQPFERMATGPTSAKYSIFAQYLSTSLSWNAFTSLAQGNPVPLLASVLYVLVTVGAPVAAASMSVKARSYCDVNGVSMRCDPVWVVNVPLLRGVEAALAVCFGLVLLILRSVTRTKSRLASDPSSLASLASLMNHGPLLNDIQGISPNADCAAFKDALSRHQFLLDYHRDPQGELIYGVIGLKNANIDFETPELESNSLHSNAYISSTKRQYSYHSIPDPGRSSSSFARTTALHRARNHLLTDTLGLLLPLTIFILVLTWYLDDNNDPLNNFFNSETLWPKFLLVALATLSALHLSHLERVVRITEPFRRLAANADSNQLQRNRPSPAETTLLISRSGTPHSNLLHCISLFLRQDIFRRRSGRMSFQTLVTITAVLADLNIIAAAGVAFNDAQIWQVYKVSSIGSITLSAWIVLVYVVILLWWRRQESVRAVSEDLMGVSVGVGTVGGAMRWLLSGRNSRDVLETIAKVREEADGRKCEGWDVDTEYRGRKEMGAGRPNIWFGKTGSVDANGLRRWGFGVDAHAEVHERTWMNTRMNEKGSKGFARHEEYFGPPARGAEMRNERVSGEEYTLGQQANWQGGRFPSLSGRNVTQDWRVSREDERLWGADGDLGMRRSSRRGA